MLALLVQKSCAFSFQAASHSKFPASLNGELNSNRVQTKPTQTLNYAKDKAAVIAQTSGRTKKIKKSMFSAYHSVQKLQASDCLQALNHNFPVEFFCFMHKAND